MYLRSGALVLLLLALVSSTVAAASPDVTCTVSPNPVSGSVGSRVDITAEVTPDTTYRFSIKWPHGGQRTDLARLSDHNGHIDFFVYFYADSGTARVSGQPMTEGVTAGCSFTIT